MAYDDLMKVKSGHSHNNIRTSVLISPYFIFTLSKFRYICDDLWTFQFFVYISYVETFDDLAKVKQGHTQMSSISSLHHNSMTKNLWKFHASTLIFTIIAQIRPSHELWWPPKVKKGHS